MVGLYRPNVPTTSEPMMNRSGNCSMRAGHRLSSTLFGAISCSKMTQEISTRRFGYCFSIFENLGVVRDDDPAADACVRPDDLRLRMRPDRVLDLAEEVRFLEPCRTDIAVNENRHVVLLRQLDQPVER